MEKRRVMYVMLLACALFAAGGCAKQELVKKDEGIAPQVAAKPVEQKHVATQPAQKPAIPAEQPKQQAASSQEAAKSSDAESSLQSALEKVYFNFDSADLSEQARAALTQDAGLLQKQSAAKIRIEGNCDERGSAEYNLALGERRAVSAKKYLVTLGIAEGRLSTISYGKERPAVQGHDEAAWAKNRRDEFVVIP